MTLTLTLTPQSDEINDRNLEAEDKLRRIVGHELIRDFQVRNCTKPN